MVRARVRAACFYEQIKSAEIRRRHHRTYCRIPENMHEHRQQLPQNRENLVFRHVRPNKLCHHLHRSMNGVFIIGSQQFDEVI
jgi:hypothetical protein